jgi:hypothetical protein
VVTRNPAHRPVTKSERGSVIAYVAIALVVGVGLCLVAVDYGRAQFVRMQLQSCADGAARAGASGIPTSLAEARTRAGQVGSLNTADGKAITFEDADFTFGKWNTDTNAIDAASGSAIDAVEVITRRTVPLTFGQMFGKASTDVSARAVGKVIRRAPTGFIGLEGFVAKNNLFLGGFVEAPNFKPTTSSATSDGAIGTNGALTLNNNQDLHGFVLLGPDGSYPQNDPEPTRLTKPIAAPTIPPMPKGQNPNNVSHSYTAPSGTTTLPGGTYWFNSLKIAGTLTFSGPATIFVNGNVDLQGELRAFQEMPSNLTVYVVGDKRTFGDAKANGSSSTFAIVGNVIAPTADLEMKNNFHYSGAGYFKTITMKNNAHFFYDQELGDPSGKSIVQMVR